MPEQLPRFNQQFIQKLPPDCVERDFVAAVGDVTFLARTNIDVIGGINVALRRPFLFGDYKTGDDRRKHVESFSDDYEKELDNHGLNELVVALNSLKVATTELHGRSLSWVTSRFKRDEEPTPDDAYLIGSKIGFYYEIDLAPALLLQIANNSYDTNGVHIPLADLWDIRVDPK